MTLCRDPIRCGLWLLKQAAKRVSHHLSSALHVREVEVIGAEMSVPTADHAFLRLFEHLCQASFRNVRRPLFENCTIQQGMQDADSHTFMLGLIKQPAFNGEPPPLVG